MKTVKIFALFLITCIFCAGCAQNISPGVYTTGQVGVANRVLRAKIVSVRPVRIDNRSGVGGLAGTVGGAAAGSTLGEGGAGSIIGAVGGAVVGGVLGSAIDSSIHKRLGKQYILKLRRTGKLISVTQVDSLLLYPGQRVLVIYGQMTRVVPDNSYLPTRSKRRRAR